MSASTTMKQQSSRDFQPIPTFTEEKPQRTVVEAMVSNAAKCIAPVWPLETFVACNPLQGLKYLPFEEALLEGKRLFSSVHAIPKLELVNRELIKWCGVFLDMGQGTIRAPNCEKGFYAAFLSLVVYDRSIHQRSKSIKSWLKNLPRNAEETILFCLRELGVASEHQESFLRESFAYLPGWAGYVKWRSEWRNPHVNDDYCPVTLLDFIAVRLVLTVALWPEAPWEKKLIDNESVLIDSIMAQIKKSEQKYQYDLVTKLMQQPKSIQYPESRSDVQLVFCIDVRSESLRRSIESLGAYETFGFSGFFGIPARIHEYPLGRIKDSCPVLLKPRYDIEEKPISSTLSCVNKNEQGNERFDRLKTAYKDLKYNFSTPFVLAETLGVWCGITMLARTLSPSLAQKARSAFCRKMMSSLSTQPVINRDNSCPQYGICAAEQALYGETALQMMGLTHNFAQLVVFCGHRSTTENNPYASALDCAACGGNHGGSNAKILAAVLNTHSVRQTLAERGIAIPNDTLFYAAEHDTTTDEISLYETDLEHHSHQELLERLRHDLGLARNINSQVRCQNGGGRSSSNSIQTTLTRSSDWAEVRPEWGLARNAAFIIGPRQLTKQINLEGRCFLHSYDWMQDENGTSLEQILTTPMIVAEWINSQYLFSTLDNVNYGSGSKITQNVTGRLGIMQGNGSDLMYGLPLQAVNSSDKNSYHEPQRLLTVVYGLRATVDVIITRQEILKTLFYNGWVALVVIEPEEEDAYQLDREGQWHSLGRRYALP